MTNMYTPIWARMSREQIVGTVLMGLELSNGEQLR